MAACWQQGYESWTSSSPMKSSFRTISATISIALYDPLRAAADRNDRAMSWIIRQALQDFLAENKDLSRADPLQATRAAQDSSESV